MNKFDPPCEQKGYRCGIYIYKGFYDRAWIPTNRDHPRPRNPHLPRDIFDWHYFYRIFLESLPLLTQEQELALLHCWQLGGDIEARNHLILSLARIVGPIAGRAVTRRFPKLNGDGWLEAVHEIICWGNLGLVDAPSKITLSRGFRLSTVANQWIKKYIHDGLASLTSSIYYPERKRTLAKFDSQLAVASPEEDADFEAFDSFGNPTNPELKLGYLQRQVGKRLYPWHDWGPDWRLLGVDGRFALKGGVSLDVQDSGHHERPSLLDWPKPRDERTERTEWNFLNEWTTWLFKPPHKPWRPSRNLQDRYRPTNPGNAVVATDVIVDICLLDNRRRHYSFLHSFAEPRRISSELVRLVEHVCTDVRDVRDNSWRDVPERRQLDAYCHWDKYGNRVDKVTLLRRHVRVSGVDDKSKDTEALARKGTNLAPVDWFAHTADGIAPVSWNINRHWHTTYPIAFDNLRRSKFTARAHDYFALLYGKFGLPAKAYPESKPTKCRAPKRKDPKPNIYADCIHLAQQARSRRKAK